MVDAEVGRARERRHGMPVDAVASPVNILSDLSSSGGVQALPERVRGAGGRIAGVGMLVAGALAAIAWMGHVDEHAEEVGAARNVRMTEEERIEATPLRDEGAARIVETMRELPLPEVPPERGMQLRTTMPVNAEKRVAVAHADGVRPSRAKAPPKRDVRSGVARKPVGVVAVRKERQRGTVLAATGRVAAQKPVSTRLASPAKPAVIKGQGAAGVGRPVPDSGVQRVERDVDIITAIVK